MQLTTDDVKKIANLARIQLSDEEVGKYLIDLSKILTYVQDLMQVNVDGVEEVSQVTGLLNVQRLDKAVLSVNRDKILQVAPAVKDDFVQVKAIL